MVIEKLVRNRNVDLVEMDQSVTADQLSLNDGHFGKQWGLDNQANPSADIAAWEAWALYLE